MFLYLKTQDMPWKIHVKTARKVKIEFESDLEIVEIIPSRVGSKNDGMPGSLLCKSSDNLLTKECCC